MAVSLVDYEEKFSNRHIGPRSSEIEAMLNFLGLKNLEDLTRCVVPESIRLKKDLDLPKGMTEFETLKQLKTMAHKNKVFKSMLGLGFHDSIIPSVIKRLILENPGWYTPYTPYQAELAQGRLEALLNFQTMITELTSLPVTNASLLDEATAAAEAMALCYQVKNKEGIKSFFVSKDCFPQTIQVIKGRATALGINVIVDDHRTFDFSKPIFGVLLQYPSSVGTIFDYSEFIAEAHKKDALVALSCDLMSLTLLKSPGELGADIALGSSQRFGVPLGFGGPHAAFFATKNDYIRLVPGRIVGVSKDAHGNRALRLTLQTREQHIRREKATSNICTAQALLATMSSFYAVYHGPTVLKKIAQKIHALAIGLARGVSLYGYKLEDGAFFDTVSIKMSKAQVDKVVEKALNKKINLRKELDRVVVSLDETTTIEDISTLFEIFSIDGKSIAFEKISTLFEIFSIDGKSIAFEKNFFDGENIPASLKRTSSYLTQPVFNQYHSEPEFTRYVKHLEAKDISLIHSMIPLGSCTMKLNAVAELTPVSWPEFSSMHPFSPREQTEGYRELFKDLEGMLATVTGFDAVSLQPNSGAQGEFAGLLVIKAYLADKKEEHRNICLIPQSAHGTNPASAAMAGLKVVLVKCDVSGNIDVLDLEEKAKKHSQNLAVAMITYPSTHGVFESEIVKACHVVHENGGQVYLDGANLNAQLGLSCPGLFGADVCHVNLHKTFCIPHGGGGPGMGPIAVKKHLAPYLPGHWYLSSSEGKNVSPVSGSPWGSASILPISWTYIKMMGSDLKKASMVAILNANYIAKRLEEHYPVLYRGEEGFVAHECIINLRQFKESSGIEVQDVAKRLMDYGFHAPTVSFPVPGTMMIEPTESESKVEIDRFCDALIAIRKEISSIESQKLDRQNNIIKNAPHTVSSVMSEAWDRSYSREEAVFPTDWVRTRKFWPSVGRIDDAFGDRNVICSCS